MSFNLLALCKDDDNLVVCKISVTNYVQKLIEKIFNEQKNNFSANKTIVKFTGDWKPDNDELFEIDIPNDANIIVNAISVNLSSIEEYNIKDFDTKPIKALFGKNDSGEILIQNFFKSQYLGKKFSLFLSNNVYNQLTEPAIFLDNKLLCYISDNTLKFKNFNNLRYLFDMSDFYKEATNSDIDLFGSYENIEFDDIETFKKNASQNNRKRIHNILNNGFLKSHKAEEIQEIAKKNGLNGLIEIRKNKVFIPNDKTQLNKILSFLDEKLYKGPFSQDVLRANSTKKEN